MQVGRRGAIPRYKQPFVDWINSADPSPTSHTLTLAEANQEHPVYLVEVEDEDELAEWLAVITRSFRRGARRVVHGPGAVAPGPIAQDAQEVVFLRTPHRRGGHRYVSARRR